MEIFIRIILIKHRIFTVILCFIDKIIFFIVYIPYYCLYIVIRKHFFGIYFIDWNLNRENEKKFTPKE